MTTNDTQEQIENGTHTVLQKVRENRTNALAALDKAVPELEEGNVKAAVEHCYVAIENTSSLLDMVTSDLVNVIKNLGQLSDVVVKSGVTTEVLLETLVEKEVITADDYKATFEKLKAQAAATSQQQK